MENNFDFSKAKPVSEVPALQQLRQAYQDSRKDDIVEIISHLDDDVIQILKQHNTETDYKRLNGVIKAMFVA